MSSAAGVVVNSSETAGFSCTCSKAVTGAGVLCPGGVPAPFGLVYQVPPTVAQALAVAYGGVVSDSPLAFGSRPEGSILDAYQALYVKAADGIREAGGYGEPVLWRYDWERAYTHTRDELLDLIPHLRRPHQPAPEPSRGARSAKASFPGRYEGWVFAGGSMSGPP
jgi:hypothetical protein